MVELTNKLTEGQQPRQRTLGERLQPYVPLAKASAFFGWFFIVGAYVKTFGNFDEHSFFGGVIGGVGGFILYDYLYGRRH
jgi:hypothetical protein